MPIPLSSFTFDGFAYAPGSLTFGDAETKEILRSVGSTLRNLKLKRAQVNISLEGLTSAEALPYLQIADAGTALRTILIANKNLTNCILTSAIPNPQYIVGNYELVNLDLGYESQDWNLAFEYESFQGFPVKPEDIKFGEADAKDLQKEDGNNFKKIRIYRRTCDITLRGILAGAISQFRLNSVSSFTIGGISMPNAVLLSLQPGSITKLLTGDIREEVQLKYETKDYVQNVDLETFDGHPLTEEDVQFSYEEKTIPINGASVGIGSGGGGLKKDVIVRKTKVTIALKGTDPSAANTYLSLLEQTPQNPPERSITVAGRTIPDAILVNVNPSGIITVDEISLRPTLQLEYKSAKWSDGNGSSSTRFKGFEVDGVSFGNAESQQVEVNNNGTRSQFAYTRQSITINLSGVPTGSVSSFFGEAANNRRNLRNAPGTGETISLLGVSISNCVLLQASPSGKTNTVGGTEYVDSLSLSYDSTIWT
jgi:hypothetical protein